MRESGWEVRKSQTDMDRQRPGERKEEIRQDVSKDFL